MERSAVVARFRDRMTELIARSGLRHAGFARKVGVARSEGVSIDWLLGLSAEGQMSTDVLLRSPVEIERDARSPADERLDRWHEEAAGYPIRYVPATLPDLFKTEQVIEFEYKESAAFTPEQSLATTQAKIAYLRRPDTVMEVCMSRQRLEVFARGEGIWRGLSDRARRAQLKVMRERVDDLYPSLRCYLFDERQRFSIPIIVFGPLRAVLYVGQMYLVFNSTEHVTMFSQHFDDLLRAAVVQPTEMASTLARLETA
jgi:hypothetical protein